MQEERERERKREGMRDADAEGGSGNGGSQAATKIPCQIETGAQAWRTLPAPLCYRRYLHDTITLIPPSSLHPPRFQLPRPPPYLSLATRYISYISSVFSRHSAGDQRAPSNPHVPRFFARPLYSTLWLPSSATRIPRRSFAERSLGKIKGER